MIELCFSYTLQVCTNTNGYAPRLFLNYCVHKLAWDSSHIRVWKLGPIQKHLTPCEKRRANSVGSLGNMWHC